MYNRLDLDLIEIDVFGGKMLYIFSHNYPMIFPI